MMKKLFLAVAIVIVAMLVALVFLTPRVVPEAPLPSPNGYDDFVKAATIVSRNSFDWNSLSGEALHQLVATNEPALSLIRTGLTKESRMAPYILAGTNNSHMSEMALQKLIAHAFCAASRLALTEGHTNDAAILALDCIRYSHESTRGGVIIDGLVGVAIQANGLARLEEALPGLDAETSRKVTTGLENLAGKRESPENIFTREAEWARRGRFGHAGILTQLIQSFRYRKLLAKAKQKFEKGVTDLQRTKLRAAAHAYELEHAKPPASARELVPQYLKSIPLDPATGKELPLN